MSIESMFLDYVSYINTKIGAELSAIETGAGDGIALPDFKFHGEGYVTPFNLPKYPGVIHAIDRIDPEEATMSSVDLRMTVNTLVVLRDSKPEVLLTKQSRYADAFFNLWRKDMTMGNAYVLTDILDFDIFPGAPQNQDLGIVIITMQLQRSE